MKIKYKTSEKKRKCRQKYYKKIKTKLLDLCRCGNKKWKGSKRCIKCFHSNKLIGQISRLQSLKEKK